jgi:hypothetical protein
MQPARLIHTNPDVVFCAVVLIACAAFPIGIITYSVKRYGITTLRRPSWFRSPLNWWGDPLQSLFIVTLIMAGYTLGSLLWHPAYNSIGFWTVSFYSCMVLGLVIGQSLAYRVYKTNITRP